MTIQFFGSRRAMILILLFVFALSLRLGFLSRGPFHIDALDLAQSSEKTLETLRLHYEHGTGYPLTVLFGAAFIAIFKMFGVADPIFCVNVMSAFFGALGVVLMFLFVERLCDEPRALASAVLMACFAPHLAISTFGKSLTLSICFALASFYFATCYYREGRRAHLLASAFFLGFCAASRLSDAVIGVPLIFLLAARPGRPMDRLRASGFFLAVAAATAFLYYVPMFFEEGFSTLTNTITQKNEAAYLGVFSWVLKYSFAWLLEALEVVGVASAIAGFGFMLIRRRFFLFGVLAVWFLVVQLFYGNVSSSGPRYLAIGWLSLLVAQGYFFGSYKGRSFWASLLVLAMVSAGNLFAAAPALEFRHRYALQVDFARWIASQTTPEDLIIAMDEGAFIQAYGRREVLGFRVASDEAEIERFFREEVDGALAARRRVYLISTAFSYDWCRGFKQRIERDYRRVMIGSRVNEDWHHALVNQKLFREALWEIKKK